MDIVRLKKEEDIRKAATQNGGSSGAEGGADSVAHLLGTREKREGASLSEGTSDASTNNEIRHSSPVKSSCACCHLKRLWKQQTGRRAHRYGIF